MPPLQIMKTVVPRILQQTEVSANQRKNGGEVATERATEINFCVWKWTGLKFFCAKLAAPVDKIASSKYTTKECPDKT